MSDELTYESQRDLIEKAIALVCRIKHLPAADADDFGQEARMKFVMKGTLQKYDGRGSLQGFVRMVVLRAFKDYRIRQWGKWRPSVHARRNGPVAEWLEQYIVRDGFTFEQAFDALCTNHGVTMTREKLEALAARLPLRVLRKPESDAALVSVPDGGPLPDAVLLRKELEALAVHIREALRAELEALNPRDRLIIKLRYVDGLQIVQIARLLQEPEKPLFRHIEQLCRRLRRALKARGIDPKDFFGGDKP